jgi:hypothetical protein
VDFDKVGAPSVVDTASTMLSVDIVGAPGAVPGGAELRVTGLDTSAPPTVESADADGSFLIEVAGDYGQEFRFQLVGDGQRSEPQDAVYSLPGSQTPHFEPSRRFDCVALSSGFELELPGGNATVTLSNDCQQPVTLANLRSRTDQALFTLTSALPPTLSPGAAATLSFEFNGARPAEDILFLNITLAGETIRYPLTLYAP